MSSRRTKRGSLVAILATLLLSLGTLAPAEALTSRAISLAVSPSASVAGSTVTFAGRVSRSPKGSVVRLQRKAGSSWVTIASTRTVNTTGSYAVRAALPKVPAAYSYRTVAPRTTKLATAVSAVRTGTALRRTTVSLKASPTLVNPGGQSLLTGKVSPFVPGTTAVVQRLSGSSWLNVTTVIVSTSGDLSRGVNPTAPTYYRVVVPRAGLNATGISPSVLVSVNLPPKITTTALNQADQGVPYSMALARTGKAGTWSATGLPAGISLNATTGALSGTPTVSGPYSVTVKYLETSTELSATKVLPLTVTAPPVITTSALPDATRFSSYTTTLTRTSAYSGGTWNVQGLPGGLTYSTSSGVISGTPSAVTGTYPISVTFTDIKGRQTSKGFALKIAGLNAGISTAALTEATRAQQYSFQLVKTGGPGTWSETGLPPTLTLNTGTGLISGVPSAETGTYPVQLSFTETATNTTVTKTLDLEVIGEDLDITTTELPDGTRGSAYSATLTKTGGAGTWSAAGLPAGLTVNTGTGVISGTPVAHTGSYVVTVTFKETATNLTVSTLLGIGIDGDEPSVTTTSLPDGTTSTAYSAQLTKTGLSGTWSLTKGTLPAGLTLSSGGLVSGTPTAFGDFLNLEFTFTETASGFKASRTIYLHISKKGAPAIETLTLPDGEVGTPYSADLAATPSGGTWKVDFGTLPDGLSLGTGSGKISGTPTTAGDSTVIVRYTSFLGLSGYNTKRYTIHIAP